MRMIILKNVLNWQTNTLNFNQKYNNPTCLKVYFYQKYLAKALFSLNKLDAAITFLEKTLEIKNHNEA